MMFSPPSDLLRKIYPSLCWEIESSQNEVFLTFDDGPTPGVTNLVLDRLKKHNAKATFFCIGNNVVKHPELFQRILNEGHTVGNHTYNHMNGWKNTTSNFLYDIKLFDEVYQSNLFRPPYGKIRPSQIAALKEKYNIIMWSILSRDYDSRLSTKKCMENTLKKLKVGSIVVFHDSVKAKKNMLPTLDAVLEEIDRKGWKCNCLTNELQ